MLTFDTPGVPISKALETKTDFPKINIEKSDLDSDAISVSQCLLTWENVTVQN
jgi:hypothetical protein